jgi:hypothetical protein
MESKFVESEVSGNFEEFIINKLYKIRQVRTRGKKGSAIREQQGQKLGTKRKVIYIEKKEDRSKDGALWYTHQDG